ncbi:agenet domain-containing protein [Striga hermonthica]|uniref:Agenet domain-containing protein n=1 Tax=Striga hermonthica TaxID=68872 RepID=A0A9N7RDU0_STRHE|nr:agenet domain-containing protein [Striga hermonthica]
MGGAATHQPLRKRSNKNSSSHHHLHDGDHRAGVQSDPFPVGALVEVRTHEPDFKDTYFSATVVSLGDKSSGEIQVEYQTLLVPRGGSKLLREYVDVSCVRPSPPLEEAVGGFGPGDAVDALYNDGWWIGVVTRVVEEDTESRYTVTFQNPPDVREFSLSELRVHWDWVNGSWVRPDRQSIAGWMFDMEKEVEVSIDREDGQEAWFPATIHEHLVDGTYLVKYHDETKESEAHTTQLIVDSLHIRPQPPLLKDTNFVLLGKVDAYFDCGWWSGLIRAKLEDSRYLVTFKQLNMQKEFHMSELRPHMEWKDEKWFISPQDVKISPPDGGMDVNHTSNNSSALPNSTSPTCQDSQVEQLTPNLKKTPNVTPRTKRTRRSYDSKNALSQCQKKLKEGPVIVEKQQGKHEMTKEILSDSVSPVSANNVEFPGKQSATGDLSSDNPSWGKRTRRGKNVTRKINSTPRDVKNSGAQTSQVEYLQPGAEGKKPDAVDNTAEDAQNVQVVVIGLPCGEMVISGPVKSRDKRKYSANSKEIMKNKEKQNLHDATTQEIEGKSQYGFVGSDDSNTNEDDHNRISQLEAVGTDSSEKMSLDGGTSPSDLKGRKGAVKKKTSARKLEEKVVKESMQQKKSESKRGKRRSMTSPQFEGKLLLHSANVSGGKSAEVNPTPGVNNDSEAPSIELDDQPLSKWIGGKRIQSPSTVDGSRLSPVTAAVKQFTESNEKQGEDDAAVLKEATGNPQDTQIQISTEHQNLPFTKTSLLWKTIWSLNAFCMLPQKPHFQPLESIKESMREGIAIGLMVNFSSAVETTCKLQFDDPKSTMDDILETLAELGSHGFDVEPVRARVVGLLAVKDKEVELMGRAKELDCEISGHQLEKGELEKEIEELNEQARKLQEKLSMLESAKEGKENEIASAGARLREAEQSLENLKLEFEGIASSAMLM